MKCWMCCMYGVFFFFSSRRRHTRWTGDWSSDVCSSDLAVGEQDDRVDPAGVPACLDGLVGGEDGVVQPGAAVDLGLDAGEPGEQVLALARQRADRHHLFPVVV